jgi:ribA/ribD-fused uncharacterized protein
MRVENGFTFFWKKTPLSNWYVGQSFIVDGVTFRTSEHYMMYKKAELFGDTVSMGIMLNDLNKHPREVKARGREVKPFDDAKWKAVARDIMFVGLRQKFLQDENILPVLMNTKGTRLVEASIDDRIWGVAMLEEDDRILDPANWRGLNWLGETLDRVRESI